MDKITNYDVILSQTTLLMIIAYKNALLSNTTKPGAHLNRILNDERVNLEQTSNEAFIQLLLWTKQPMIFAESEVVGDGTDWNTEELRILGDLSIAMKVSIFDNGVWYTNDGNYRKYDPPMNGTLLFMPGPLLYSTYGTPADLQEILDKDNIDQGKYNRLVDRRLTPLLYYVNEKAAKGNIRAVVTIPGVGCGQFAGKFNGTMGEHLNLALQAILAKHATAFGNIACVYYDPFSECTNQERQFENVKYRVRPGRKNPRKTLLGKPKEYEEHGDDFENCRLFKVVAWDHVSYPGNDFFSNSRSTDDGVSAAATNSMQIVTGVEGKYQNGKYLPPTGTWLQVTHDKDVKLTANPQNIYVTYSQDLE